MAGVDLKETKEGYLIYIQSGINEDGDTMYRYVLYKNWPKFTNLTSLLIYPTPKHAEQAAKEHIRSKQA